MVVQIIFEVLTIFMGIEIFSVGRIVEVLFFRRAKFSLGGGGRNVFQRFRSFS